MKHIVSRDNPHFKALKRLCQSGRERRKIGSIVLDGMHLVQSYVEHHGQPGEIVVSESGMRRDEITRYLDSDDYSKRLTLLTDTLFEDLTRVETPTGILAIAPQPSNPKGFDQQGDTVLLDGIQDPGNVGSILRSAAAAGFRQILLSEDCAQVWSPKVLRAGMGAHFQLELHESVNLPAFLAGYGGQAILTILDKTVDSLYLFDLNRPVAWVFGNEGQGVSQAVANVASCAARIPMSGTSESLNVAAAAAICLFETVRQRSSTTL